MNIQKLIKLGAGVQVSAKPISPYILLASNSTTGQSFWFPGAKQDYGVFSSGEFYQNVDGVINRSIYMTNAVEDLDWHFTEQGILKYAPAPIFNQSGMAMIYYFYVIESWVFRFTNLSWQDDQIALGSDYRGIFGDWTIRQLI